MRYSSHDSTVVCRAAQALSKYLAVPCENLSSVISRQQTPRSACTSVLSDQGFAVH